MKIASMNNMRTILIGIIALASFTAAAQVFEVPEEKKCYERYYKDGSLIPKSERRYAEWECGKLAGVVDCNDKLTYDEGTGLVYAGTNSTPFTGTCETCHMTGVINHRITFVNGKEHGVDTTYYSSKCPQVVRSHVQGARMGTWYYYYDSTNLLAWEMNYQMDELHGKQIYFKLFKNGSKDPKDWERDTVRWENYQNGVLHGTKRTYYKDSKLKSEINYENGIFHGSYKQFNEDGVEIQEMTYKNGKKDGEVKYFYDDGKPLRTENWNEDVKEGEFKVFYYQGHVQTEELYRKGVRIGTYIEYYPNQVIRQKIIYDKKGVRIEEHRYDENGRETYAFGTPDDANGAEDDEMPSSERKKKKKKKKKDE